MDRSAHIRAACPAGTGHTGASVGTLMLSAIGVVFGDIGTSPLYALQEALSPAHGIGVTHDNVLGILSLVVWALILVVTVKYLVFVLRADNDGEGGILALTSLVAPLGRPVTGARERLLVALGSHPDGPRHAPAQPAQDAPHLPRVVAHPSKPPDHLGDAPKRPQFLVEAVPPATHEQGPFELAELDGG